MIGEMTALQPPGTGRQSHSGATPQWSCSYICTAHVYFVVCGLLLIGPVHMFPSFFSVLPVCIAGHCLTVVDRGIYWRCHRQSRVAPTWRCAGWWTTAELAESLAPCMPRPCGMAHVQSCLVCFPYIFCWLNKGENIAQLRDTKSLPLFLGSWLKWNCDLEWNENIAQLNDLAGSNVDDVAEDACVWTQDACPMSARPAVQWAIRWWPWQIVLRYVYRSLLRQHHKREKVLLDGNGISVIADE
jgi:hypothetical protein